MDVAVGMVARAKRDTLRFASIPLVRTHIIASMQYIESLLFPVARWRRLRTCATRRAGSTMPAACSGVAAKQGSAVCQTTMFAFWWRAIAVGKPSIS